MINLPSLANNKTNIGKNVKLWALIYKAEVLPLQLLLIISIT